MRRLLAVIAIASTFAAPAGLAAEEPEILYRASARSSAIHAFYDHEGLFPVPILDVSIPYAEATLEPGPSSSALGSFLWDPEAAELGTILCFLSEGQLCDVPEYPFQARASYPASGRSEPPPTLEIDQPGAPLNVRAAHERADAGRDGANASADVAKLKAIPMSPRQAAAARGLALALAPFARAEVATDPWLVSVGAATSRSKVVTDPGGVVSRATSALHDVAILGGLIEVGLVRADTTATIARRPHGEARSRVVEVSVAGLDARITPRGIEIVDREIPAASLAPLNEALDAALEEAAIDLRRGRERVRRSDDAAHAEAFALSLDLERRTLPEELPEGTQGRDVLHLPLGFASADAAVAQIVPPPPSPPPADEAPAPVGDGAIDLGVGPGVGGVGGTGPIAAPPSVPAQTQPAAAEAFALSNLGVPVRAVVAVLAAAVLLALALTWLRVNEVLHE